jgi:predicted DNA-binding protein with PD1-like motif
MPDSPLIPINNHILQKKLMEPYTTEPQQKTEKRTWITPELELISHSGILSGTVTGAESVFTHAHFFFGQTS